MNLSAEYPLGFIFLCLSAGLTYSVILYYRNTRDQLRDVTKVSLAIMRFVSISLISFLLLSPMIRSTKRTTEKPVILLAVDNSASVTVNKDSIFYMTSYVNKLNDLAYELSRKYELHAYTFGENVKEGMEFNALEKQTDFTELFTMIKDVYNHRNVGALLLATDGIYNRGENPLYGSKGLGFPIYTIALGDTTVKRDLLLKKINFNSISYLGNEYPLEILISAQECQGEQSMLRVLRNGKQVYSQNLLISSSDFLKKIEITLPAEDVGLHHLVISLSPIIDEISLPNNIMHIYIDVLEGRQKILLLANAPHPDVAALRQAILTNKNYEIESFLADDFNQSVSGFDLIILHGLPSIRNALSGLFEEIKKNKLPVLYITSRQTFIISLTNLQAGLTIQPDNLIYNEATPRINEEFQLFTLSPATSDLISYLPPLISPYGSITQLPVTSALFYQNIGNVNTQIPLMAFSESADNRNSFILGEGIWKWRMKDYLLHKNHEAFDDLINKTVQYLSLKIDKRLFRIHHKGNFDETEDIELEAEVYNDVYDRVNDPEVRITIADENNKEFPFLFNKTKDAYFLNAGRFKPGSYTYRATVQLGNKVLTDQGEFMVTPLNIEITNTTADHNLLYNIASASGGSMIYPAGLEHLDDLISARNDIHSISYAETVFDELLNSKWLLILIISLVCFEWFFRKRSGTY